MTKRYTLGPSDRGDWYLKGYGDVRAVKRFPTKAEGIEYVQGMGVPRSVVIRTLKGRIQEERTYPRSVDPTRFPG